MWARGIVAVSLALIGSCSGQKTATQVMVMVTADDALAERAASVVFEVPTSSGPVTDVITLGGRDIRPDQKPVQIPLFPIDGDVSQSYEITIELRDEDETVIGEQALSGTYIQNEFREVWAFFDEGCETSRCPSGYRCQEGDCVEYCVSPQLPGETTRTGPVPCGEPCAPSETVSCFGDDIAQCDENGTKILERRCGFGCESGQTACHNMDASNVPDLEFPAGLRELVIDQGTSLLLASKEAGAVLVNDEIVCPTSCGEDCLEDCNVEQHGVDFRLVDGGIGCDGEPQQYAVFSFERLHVLPKATLTLAGLLPIIVLVNQEVILDGTISAGATKKNPGPGGCLGASVAFTDAVGARGGKGVPDAGGGGGSFGGRGGDGGSPDSAEGGGAQAGSTEDDSDLVPLLGGGGGGAGGNNFILPSSLTGGGAGGGALQISTNGRIMVGSGGRIVAGGGGGSSGEKFGSGGGSGGALLLEAGELACYASDVEEPRIGTPGGGGGNWSREAFFAPASGTDGSLSAAAPGGSPSGGAGSWDDGDASAGTMAEGGFAGGGGGGAGRVRINTREPMNAEQYEQQCGLLLEPTSFGTVDTVGE